MNRFARCPLPSAGIVGLICLIGFLCLTGLVAWGWPPLIRFDTMIANRVLSLASHHPGWITGWRIVTHGGDSTTLLLLTAIVAVDAHRRGYWDGLRYLFATALVSIAVRLIVRALVARPRPGKRLIPVGNWSYPSGHTLYSALCALAVVVLGLGLASAQWQRLLLVAGGLAWALSAAASRVALVVHWPSDLLGSWLLLGSAALLCSPLYRPPRRAADRAHLPHAAAPGSG